MKELEELKQILIEWRDGFRKDAERLGFKVQYPSLSQEFWIDEEKKIIYYPSNLNYFLSK